MNHILLVGIVQGKYHIVYDQGDHNKKLIQFLLKIKRPFKNKEGLIDFDVIKVKVWSNLIQNIDEQISDQEVLSVKGRLQSYVYKNSEDEAVYINDVIAERIVNIASEF